MFSSIFHQNKDRWTAEPPMMRICQKYHPPPLYFLAEKISPRPPDSDVWLLMQDVNRQLVLLVASGVILMIRKYLFLYIFLRYINVWSTLHSTVSAQLQNTEMKRIRKNRKSETGPHICLCLKLGISSCLEFRN